MPAFDAACAERNRHPYGSPEEATAQAEVDRLHDAMYCDSHYFRDSYNSSSLFWMIDLSWWQNLEPYVDETCTLQPEGARALRKEIADRAELLLYNIRDLPDEHETHLSKRYFTEKFDRLLAFLQTAADAGDPIHCSV
jgi:hypothetical protein